MPYSSALPDNFHLWASSFGGAQSILSPFYYNTNTTLPLRVPAVTAALPPPTKTQANTTRSLRQNSPRLRTHEINVGDVDGPLPSDGGPSPSSLRLLAVLSLQKATTTTETG